MKLNILITALLIILLTGCTISKSEPTSIIDEPVVKTTVSEETANKSTEVKDNNEVEVVEETIEESQKETEEAQPGKESNETPINQTPFIVTEDGINGYHELIKDLHDLNLGLDLTDVRLSGLIEHLSQYTYNTSTHQIGEVSVPDSIYVLANKLNHLPEDYTPDPLRVPDIRFSIAEYNEKKNQREEPAKALELMFADAESEFHYLFAVSGYRSYNRQQTIYNYKVDTRGLEAADEVSARPGHSEHQTGLAMDITCESVGFGLEYAFGNTPEGIWVAENAHKYGFIIRYLEDKVDITGYNYEPWHLRYVGIDLASYVHENQLTLEELYSSILNQLKD